MSVSWFTCFCTVCAHARVCVCRDQGDILSHVLFTQFGEVLRFVLFCFLLRRSISGKEFFRLLFKFLSDKAWCLQNHRYVLKTRSFCKTTAICLSCVLKERKPTQTTNFSPCFEIFLVNLFESVTADKLHPW